MASEKKTRKGKARAAASIYDVAKEARVSVFTVSAVVNNKNHVSKKAQPAGAQPGEEAHAYDRDRGARHLESVLPAGGARR